MTRHHCEEKLTCPLPDTALTPDALLAHRRAWGTRSSLPYGYALGDDGLHLVELPEEQVVISLIRAARVAGLSFKFIASRLNLLAVPAKFGGRWYGKTVNSALANAKRFSPAILLAWITP